MAGEVGIQASDSLRNSLVSVARYWKAVVSCYSEYMHTWHEQMQQSSRIGYIATETHSVFLRWAWRLLFCVKAFWHVSF